MSKEIHSDDRKITLYKTPRSIGQKVQIYEDTEVGDGTTYIKVGHFYKEVEIDDDGHFKTMLGGSYLETNVYIQHKKFPRMPRSFA